MIGGERRFEEEGFVFRGLPSAGVVRGPSFHIYGSCR